MQAERAKNDGPQSIQLLLDTIANAQKAMPEAPDSGSSSADSTAAA